MELYEYEKRHLEAVYSGLAECCLFLKRNGDFPLKQPGQIAAYGNGVRHTVKGGTGSGEVNSRFTVNVYEGLGKVGFTVTTDAWLDAYEAERAKARVAFVKEIKARAKEKHTMAVIESMGAVMPEPEYDLPLDGLGDTAIYVLSRISGEGADREFIKGDIRLSDTEARDILALNKKYAKFMLVLNVGGVVDLSPVLEVGNILLLSQLGTNTGTVLADILLGNCYPSGKLTATWAASEAYPELDFGDKNDTKYREGIYVGYRYFDSAGKKPLFAFGYGKSYTDFAVDPERAELEGTALTVSARVTNTGKYPGKETVQVYVSCPKGELDKAYQELAGFAKTKLLLPGETETVTVCFDLTDLASYRERDASYVLEKGSYIIRVGNSSDNTEIACVVSLEETAVVSRVKNCCGTTDFCDQEFSVPTLDIPKDTKVLKLPADVIHTRTVSYERERPIDERVKNWSDEDLAYANVGGFDPKKMASVIGTGSTRVCGAGGESTTLLENKGLNTIVMADGPAGLRLAQSFYRDKKGLHPLGESGIPASMLDFLPGFMRLFSGGSKKVKKGCVVEYQYATDIPIGTALAQSFNLEYAALCGNVVGEEMERFHVQLWLAPALNIHRSIRCGRNYEYFSEDPFVSGSMAAAVARSVQKHPGCGVVIKHFAANNQETNRYNSNSIVSERALREIYLRGFQLCVREAKPAAVMTSYNLLNGEHTSESHDLIENILRCEFGFNGIVMTDWIVMGGTFDKSSLHRGPNAALIAKAGSELVMPGGKSEFKRIMNGLKSGELSREQLQINATSLLYAAEKLISSRGEKK